MIDHQTAMGLAEGIVDYIHSRRDKKEEAFLKDKPKKNKLGLVTNGAINSRLLEIAKQHTSDTESIAAIAKSKKSKEQSALSFQIEKYERLLALFPDDVISEELLDLKSVYQQFKTVNNEEHEPTTWLTKWASKAQDISFATHVGKLTHSSSKSSSLLDNTTENNDYYLTTNILSTPYIDTAASNAASKPIADLLQISVNNQSVLDCLKHNDLQVFNILTADASLVKQWAIELKQAYDSSTKQSYFLSKQIYFPLPDKTYHLLLPLKSSSLIHALHVKHQEYFGDEQTNAREQRSDKKYSATKTIYYPNKAKLHTTRSKHLNASSLNNQRGGVITLLSCAPPPWNSKGASYRTKSSVFGKPLRYALNDEITELKKYLELLKNKTLSISEPKRNAAINRKLKNISDALFDYVMNINRQEKLNGWTVDSELPIEQQLLFEPWRDDEVAKAKKINNNWQNELSKDYGLWLTRQLNRKTKLKLTPIHEELWAALFVNELREFIAIQEVTA